MIQNNLSKNLDQWKYIDGYSRWMYHIYMDYIEGSVFEVGAGRGRNIGFYIDKCKEVVASDIFPDQIDYMKDRFQNYENFNAILLDIMEDDLEKYKGRFDTIVCINVLEHLSNDIKAVENMKRMLKTGGVLILFVPAFQKLYCQLDKNVGHYRRYNPGRLEDIVEQAGMDIAKHCYFNIFGILLYWMKGRKKVQEGESFSSSLNESNSKIYNLASRILEPLEKRFPPRIGLSEVIIVRK